MRALLDVLLLALQLYVWLLIASAIMSWLIAFNVVNTRNDVVRTIWNFLYQITEPVLRPIRNILPNLGGIDISPIILLLLIFFIQRVIQLYLYPAVYRRRLGPGAGRGRGSSFRCGRPRGAAETRWTGRSTSPTAGRCCACASAQPRRTERRTTRSGAASHRPSGARLRP